jgi:hypothetical protein
MEILLDAEEIFLRVHTHRVVGSLHHGDFNAVLKEA